MPSGPTNSQRLQTGVDPKVLARGDDNTCYMYVLSKQKSGARSALQIDPHTTTTKVLLSLAHASAFVVRGLLLHSTGGCRPEMLASPPGLQVAPDVPCHRVRCILCRRRIAPPPLRLPARPRPPQPWRALRYRQQRRDEDVGRPRSAAGTAHKTQSQLTSLLKYPR